MKHNQQIQKLSSTKVDPDILRERVTALLHAHRYLSAGEMQEMLGQPADYIKQVIKDICQMHRGGGINTHNKYSLLPRFVNEGEVTWEKEDEGGLAAPAAKKART